MGVHTVVKKEQYIRKSRKGTVEKEWNQRKKIVGDKSTFRKKFLSVENKLRNCLNVGCLM